MYEKLLKVQQEIGAIKKDSENPFFKSAYFDINSLLEVVKPVLNKNGVVLLQGLTNLNGKLALSTKLITEVEYKNRIKNFPPKDRNSLPTTEATDVWDKNENEIEFICPIPDCADPQKYGSAITYFRRYALQSLLALQAEDDDANHASLPKQASKATTEPHKAKEKVIEYPENDLDAPPF